MKISIPREHSGRVVEKKQLTPKVIWLKLELPEEIEYAPGQYGSFLIENARRPLSFATPVQGKHVEFLVDISPGGIASRYVQDVAVGDTVRFLSPYGRFVIDADDPRPRLFIAAGTGLAPIRAQIQAALSADLPAEASAKAGALAKAGPHLTLVFGNRSPENSFMLDELSAIAQEHSDRFTFIPTCDEPGANWTGSVGKVTDAITQHIKNAPDYTVYVCGGPGMVTATMMLLRELDVPHDQIHTEQFT
jgi:NAD(P)H-flavin reductase